MCYVVSTDVCYQGLIPQYFTGVGDGLTCPSSPGNSTTSVLDNNEGSWNMSRRGAEG